MNILVPDLWLREYLHTNAKPQDIFKYLSLCGPSVERYDKVDGEVVYDIEVTTNRIDAYSVYGIAREASVILPQFGFSAELSPVKTNGIPEAFKKQPPLDIEIVNDPSLINRILAVKLEDVKLAPSPEWLKKHLEQVGERGLNNAIDITNYVAHELGMTSHAFDYDRLKDKKIVVRLAKKGEKLITLDHKTIPLKGGEVVFDNGQGEIIDLPGIMGTANTVVTKETKNVLLFSENTDAVRIRRASMTHSLRSYAAVINEKNPDPVFTETAMMRAVELYTQLTGAHVGSKLVDIFPNKPVIREIEVSERQLSKYLGVELETEKVVRILEALGFKVSFEKNIHTYKATPPSYRNRDITIPEDIIEEVARIYGYHNIPTRLPDTEPPIELPDKTLTWEREVKIRLRDWGYTETYTNSLISSRIMDSFGWNKTRAYKLANPLTQDWVYLRPHLIGGLMDVIRQNMHVADNLQIFELSMTYAYRDSDLPVENPVLMVLWTGGRFGEAKGLAQALFTVFGIPFPETGEKEVAAHIPVYGPAHMSLGVYGSLGELEPGLLGKFGITKPVTRLYLDFSRLVADANPVKHFTPVPKYPPVIEDFSFTVPEKFSIGPLLTALKNISQLVASVKLIDTYETTRTVRICFQSPIKNLSTEDIAPIHQNLIQTAENSFGISLKQ